MTEDARSVSSDRSDRRRRRFGPLWLVFLACIVALAAFAGYKWLAIQHAAGGRTKAALLVKPGKKPSFWDDPTAHTPTGVSNETPDKWLAKRERPSWTPAPKDHYAVAVLPFGFPGSTAQLAPVAAAASDVLASRLSQDPSCTVVEREHLRAILNEHKLVLAGLTDSQSATRIGRLTGAGTVVTGQLLPASDDEWSIVANAYTVADGRLIASGQQAAPLSRLLEALMLLAESLAEPLQIALDELPPHMLDHQPTASLHRMRALADILDGQYLRAIMSLTKVEDLDPDDAETAYWMGVAYARAGLPAQSRIELHRYLQRRPGGAYAEEAARLLNMLPKSDLSGP